MFCYAVWAAGQQNKIRLKHLLLIGYLSGGWFSLLYHSDFCYLPCVKSEIGKLQSDLMQLIGLCGGSS